MEQSSRDIESAVRKNDFRTVDRLMDDQMSEVMQGLILEDHASGTVGSLATRRMLGANPEVNLAAVALQFVRRDQEMQGILDAGNWSGIEAKANEIIKLYKEKNGADKVEMRPGMSEQEMAQASLQFEPVMVDPNEIAEFRQQLAQLDAKLRPLGTSVWTDQRTARIASILQNSAELGRPGFLADSEQNINDQLTTYDKVLGLPALQGLEAAAQGFVDLGVGVRSVLQELGVVAVDGLTQGNVDAYYQGPTSWVQDQDGTWYHNGGKVTGLDLVTGVWQSLTGQMIDQSMAEFQNDKATAVMQAAGIEELTVGLSTVIGSIAGFMGSGGPAMQAGGWMTRGIGIAATGGKAAKSLTRTQGIVRKLAEHSGRAAALGVSEAIQKGRIEGYGTAMLHGTVMAVPMMLMGAMGDRLERTLSRYKNMPKPLARVMAGGVEGIGLDLGTMDAGWNFIQDPTDANLSALTQQVIVSSVANGLMRGVGITSVHEHGMPPDVQRARQTARRTEASTQEPQAVATKRGASTATVQALGEATTRMKANVGTDPDAAVQARHEVRTAEQRMDVEEAGLALSEREKLQGRVSVRDQIEKLKSEPNTPEKRQKIIQLMESSRLSFGKNFADFVTKNADAEMARDIAEKRNADEMLAGSDTVKALLGEKKASDYRSERGKLLAEAGVEMTDLANEQGHGLKAAEPEGEEAEIASVAKMLGVSHEEARAELGLGPALPKKTDAQKAAEFEARAETFRAQYQHLRMEDGAPDVVDARTTPPGRPGQPASLRLRPSLEQAGIPDTHPVRESDVLKDLRGYEGDQLQVPIRSGVGMRGRASTRGILGWYHTRKNEIRIGNHGGDVAQRVLVASHEWAHEMDVKTNATRGIWRRLSPAEAAGFVRAAHPYYPDYENLSLRSRAMESWAEFWARHMLDDPTLQAETGAFHDYAMKWIADPAQSRVLAQMQRSQALLRRYRDQGALARVRGTWVADSDQQSLQDLQAQGIMRDAAPAHAAGLVRRIWRNVVDHWVNDRAKFHNAQRKIIGQEFGVNRIDDILRDIDIQGNPAKLLDALSMAGTKQAEGFLETGTHDLAGNRTGESLRDIFADVGEDRYHDFVTYMVAKRALEIRAGDMPVQLHVDDYLYAVDRLESPAFLDAAKRLRVWNDRVIDYAVEGGLFSAAQAAAIKGSYDFYIPFQRVLEGVKQHAPGRGVAERGTGVKSMHGSMNEITDPVNALGDMVRNIVVKTHQNMVMKAMVKFGLSVQGSGGFVTEVKRGILAKDHPLSAIVDAVRRAATPSGPMEAATIEQATRILEDMANAGEIGAAITLFGQQTIPKGSRPLIAFTPRFSDVELDAMHGREQREARDMNNKLIWLEVDADAYTTLMGIDQPQTILDKLPDVIAKPLYGATNLVRMGATVLSPAFAARNMARDIVSDYVYTADRNRAWIFSAVGRFAHGAMSQYRGDQSAQLFNALGGGASTYFSGEVAAGRTAREMVRINRTWAQNLRRGLGQLGDLMSKYTELPLRTQAFETTRERRLAAGSSELSANLEALLAAKDRTINFTIGGSIARAIGRLTPYFTASINGNRKFLQTLSGRNGDVSARRAMVRAMTGLTVPSIVLWAMNHDEEWYQELPAWQRLNFWHVKLPGSDNPFPIPKPFELGKLFGNVPEVMLDQMAVENPLGVQAVVLDLVGSMLPPAPWPAIVKPAAEVYTNKNFFTGRQMVPEWLRTSRLPADQKTHYTRWFGGVGAGIARAFGLDPSPIVVEHLFNAYTGGMAGKLSDSATTLLGLRTALQEGSLRDVPVVGQFFRQGGFEQSRSVQAVFDLDAEFTQRAGSGHLSIEEKAHRREVSRAKDRIAELKAAAKDGTMPREAADHQAAQIARSTLKRIKR